MASDELSRKLQSRLDASQQDEPKPELERSPVRPKPPAPDGCSESTTELSAKLTRRLDINEGNAAPRFNRVFNPYTEFKEFSRKQIKDMEAMFKRWDAFARSRGDWDWDWDWEPRRLKRCCWRDGAGCRSDPLRPSDHDYELLSTLLVCRDQVEKAETGRLRWSSGSNHLLMGWAAFQTGVLIGYSSDKNVGANQWDAHRAGSRPPTVKYQPGGCGQNQYLFTGGFNDFDCKV